MSLNEDQGKLYVFTHSGTNWVCHMNLAAEEVRRAKLKQGRNPES